MSKRQYCPMCEQEVIYFSKYPKYICLDCVRKHQVYTVNKEKIDFCDKSHEFS